LSIALLERAGVSSLLDLPASPAACYVFAHGAGPGMRHAFVQAMASGLLERGISAPPTCATTLFLFAPRPISGLVRQPPALM
jgi:predicted alpha/beta-hydrolase family hydrolase